MNITLSYIFCLKFILYYISLPKFGLVKKILLSLELPYFIVDQNIIIHVT